MLRNLIPAIGLFVSSLLMINHATAAPKMENHFTHDPSRITKCNGKYFIYSTGNRCPMRSSTDLIHWTTGTPVLEHVPEWAHQAVPDAKGDGIWAPDVIEMNGQYALFYSYSTFGSKVSIIGLVTNPTLDPESPNYHWTDQGVVVSSNRNSDFNAIDPAPIYDAKGDLWLSFGSFNRGGIQLVKLDAKTGKTIGKNIFVAGGQPVGPEAPYLYLHQGEYYLFANEGFCCRGVDSTYRILMGRSKTIEGPYLDKDGNDMRHGGGTLFLGTSGSQIGPGHVGIFTEGGKELWTYHYYNAKNNGKATLGLKSLTWNADGWPEAGPDFAPPPQ